MKKKPHHDQISGKTKLHPKSIGRPYDTGECEVPIEIPSFPHSALSLPNLQKKANKNTQKTQIVNQFFI